MATDYKAELEKRLHTIEGKIKDIRIAVDDLSEAEAKSMLGRYLSAFLMHFNYWIAAARLTAKTSMAKGAYDHNLDEEISGDHPSMLYHFIADAKGLPEAKDLQAVYPAVEEVNRHLKNLSPAKAALVAALLEATAVEDMKYLEQVATKLGSKNLEYTRVHGACDGEHASELIDAAVSEMKHQEDILKEAGTPNPQVQILKDMDEVSGTIGKLLKTVFSRSNEREAR